MKIGDKVPPGAIQLYKVTQWGLHTANVYMVGNKIIEATATTDEIIDISTKQKETNDK